jgi:hypothetical protein
LNLNEFLGLTSEQRKCIKSLDLSNNSIGTLDSTIFQEFCNAVPQCIKLNSISLRNCDLNILNDTTFQVLCNTLEKCRRLQEIDLIENSIDTLNTIRLRALDNLFARIPSLKTINSEGINYRKFWKDEDLFLLTSEDKRKLTKSVFNRDLFFPSRSYGPSLTAL